MFRTGYNYDIATVSRETGLDCPASESQTQQHFKDDADINTIVRRFGLTGTLPDNYRAPLLGDFADVMDFQTAMNAVSQAQEQFMQLPPDLRSRFNNDPNALIYFMADEANHAEAIKLGLIAKPPEVDRTTTTGAQSTAPNPGATKEPQQ